MWSSKYMDYLKNVCEIIFGENEKKIFVVEFLQMQNIILHCTLHYTCVSSVHMLLHKLSSSINSLFILFILFFICISLLFICSIIYSTIIWYFSFSNKYCINKIAFLVLSDPHIQRIAMRGSVWPRKDGRNLCSKKKSL